MAKLIKNNRILLNNNDFPHEETSMKVLLAKERIFKLIQAWDDNQIESWIFPELLPQLLNDSQTINEMLKQREQEANLAEQEELAKYINSLRWNCPIFFYDEDEEYTIQYREYLEKFPDAVTTVLPTEEPEYSLSMGYEHLNTTLETESDKIIKSGVEELVPIPNECEVTSEDKRECDVPVCENSPIFDDHSEILSDSNNDDISNIEYVEASPLDPELVSLEEENVEEEFNLEDIQDVILREKLLSINQSDNSLSLSDNSSPEFETFSDHTEETRSGNTTTHANNSLLEYDSFCFEIESDEERLTNVVKDDISDDSTNDPLLEEVDLFLASDNSIPSGIENFNYDSEGDIRFLKELLVDDSILIPENESSDFDNQDDPSFPHPPPKPPDVEFDFELNSEEVIAAVKNDIEEFNEDEYFDPGGEINVFTNDEDDDYFPFIFVIRIFLPYLIYPEVFPLLLSAESEDTNFDPGISA
nr:hypothetical protein [Tanacetum cinerariifolium]